MDSRPWASGLVSASTKLRGSREEAQRWGEGAEREREQQQLLPWDRKLWAAPHSGLGPVVNDRPLRPTPSAG